MKYKKNGLKEKQKKKDRMKIQQNTENGDETRGIQNEGEAKKERQIEDKE